MKYILKEQLNRINRLISGKKLIEQVIDNPKKADFVKDDIGEFYNTLQTIANNGGLNQQKMGGMTYQKAVETMQIGLTLLGYQLPKYGIDGLYGTETANAVNKFKQDNSILNESSQELRQTLDSLGYDEKNNELTSGGEVSENITDIVGEILKQYKQSNPDVEVIITAGNDKFHKNRNSTHNDGNAIDLVIKPYNNKNASAFINILNGFKGKNGFTYIDEYTKPSKGATGGHYHLQSGGKVISTPINNVNNSSNASKEMLLKLIELLKQRGIKKEDIIKNTDNGLSIIDITTKEGFYKYANICQNFINKRQPNPLQITGEMMANGAKIAFDLTNNLVPPELALAQLVLEGGIGNKDLNVRPVRTRNPFNVGNTSTSSAKYSSVQDGINRYYTLIAKNYLGKDKNVNDLLTNFVNHSNNRYANENPNYERDLKNIISNVKQSYS